MSDRRLYFRIDDYIDLEYLDADPATVDSTPAENLFPGNAALKVYAELKKIDSEAAQLLYQIKDRDRQLADYLQLFNRKLDLLTQQLITKPRAQARPETREVNISESGIAFSNDVVLEPQQLIALNLTFLPTFVGLAVYAQIVGCEPCPNGQWQITAEFHRATDAQQQLISQQIMRAQMADKRRRQDIS